VVKNQFLPDTIMPADMPGWRCSSPPPTAV
jgi:hypothetical protein